MNLRTLILPAAAALVLAPAAAAHVTANPGEARPGSFAKFDFRVGHGCEGSPTTRLTIAIPAGVTSVKPEVVPGWEIAVQEGELPEPITTEEGETITEGVTEVRWTGGPLPDAHFSEFGLSVRLPDRPGETLYFPAVQTCEQGEHRWVEIPAAGQDPFELEEPAPFVTLAAAEAEEGAEAAEAGEQTSAESVAPAATADDGNARDNLALGLGAGGLAAGLGALGLTLVRRTRRS